jgi:hypothetical protein
MKNHFLYLHKNLRNYGEIDSKLEYVFSQSSKYHIR